MPVGRAPLYPDAIEREYAAELTKRTAAAHRLLTRAIAGAPSDAPADGARRDNVSAAAILLIIDRVRAAFARAFEPSPSAIFGVGRQVDTHTTRQTQRSVRGLIEGIALIPLDAPRAMLEEWTAENVALIKSIDDRYFDDVARVVREGVETGRATQDIARDLERRYQVSSARARLIARDQCGKLNGDLTAHKQQRIGIRRYVWTTSRDERVRPEHRALNGKIRDWSEPHPTEGHPGQAVQCRCTARPVVDWAFAETAGSQPAKRVGFEP